MSQFLMRVCSGRSDNEVNVGLVNIEGATFEERKEIATNIARSAVEETIDALATNNCDQVYCMEEMSPGRFVILVDGKPLHNVHVCLG